MVTKRKADLKTRSWNWVVGMKSLELMSSKFEEEQPRSSWGRRLCWKR